MIFPPRKLAAPTKKTINLCLEITPFGVSSTLIYFDKDYYIYHGREKEEQGLVIGGYESAFLADLVVSYLFEKANTILKWTTYHGIYRNDDLVVFNVNKSVQEIKDWLVEFQQTVNKAVGNQYLHFTVEIWTNDMNLPPSVKKYKVQIATNNEFLFLDMKIS